MAVAETGMGVVEDKVIKNHYAAEYIYNAYKNTKTCGVIEEDPAFGIKKIAEPIGIIAAVIPTTNPTSTAIFKTLIALKTRNAIIISPHPRAKNCTIEAAKIVLEAAVKAGAPEGIIGWIDVPSLELTNEVMKDADIILATGGPGMVHAAYSSGKPALGVGAGNTPVIIDETADVKLAVNSIIHSKTFDNGMICASEQSVTVLEPLYDAVKKEFAYRGCYFLKPDEIEKVRKTILINGSLNAKIVGQSAHTIAALAGVNVPESTKILIGEVESVDISEEFAHEKLSPVLAMYKAKDFDDALAKAERLVADGGYGHTSSLYYSSGKPALGVGAGNTPVIIDETADVKLAVNSIIHSKTFDNGMICASEQSVTVLEPLYDAVKKEFAYRGCYFLKPDEIDKVRKTILINGSLNAKIVGQSAHTIAALAGVNVPESTKILIGEVESVDISEEFAHEKLSPVLAMYKAKDFDDALAKAERLVADGGYGHTSSLYIHPSQTEKIMKHAEAMKTCRIVINTPSSHGGIGDLYNFKMAPSLTLGCGSWGGNSVSENVGVKHLLNIKTVAERRENMLWFRAPQKVYFKKGCMPVALDELGTVMGKKKAFIVTDSFLYKNGYVKPIEEKLDQMGIQHTCFYEVAPDPNLTSATAGAAAMRAFEPDCIIALGGGSAMDAGKIMWVMYEHPEVDFLDMAMRFMDIRKRVYTFPKMGEKAYFVAIPTSSGTGSEVTPFAVITDDRTGTKYPLADYELLPNMAIIDADNMMNQPKGLTSASGIDALTHALEAYASIMATDYTDGLALKAMKNIFAYLPSAYENGAKDPYAREKMADASCMAGMAFANAFLGVCHSMAHKLGAYHHLPHGVANALLITEVMRFNAVEVPPKMGTFSQYQYPHTLSRYVECANFCGVFGKDDQDTLNKFIDKIEELKARVGIKKTIRDYGIKEEDFLATLDEMVENAFDDQCTGANPRYPLMSEIKDMYLRAYYGEEKAN